MTTKGKILVVDDSPLVRKLSEIALQEAGYEVHVAENGEEGLKKAENIMPDLILINFIMPKMTGFQFCEKIKEIENLSQIPLVLITSKGENVIKSFLEKSLVNDYLQKPYKSEDLIEKVEQVFSKFKVEYYSTIENFPKMSFEEIQDFQQEQEKSFKEELLIDKEEAIEIKLENEFLEDITFKEQDKEELVKDSADNITDISHFYHDDEVEQKDKYEFESSSKEEIHDINISEQREQFDESENFEIKFEEKLLQEEISIPLEQEISIDDLDKQKDELISDFEEKQIYSEVRESGYSIIDKSSEVQEKKLHGKEHESLEGLLDQKLREFKEEIISRVNSSFERVLKKHGLSKNLNVTLSGTLKGNMNIENILKLIIESGIDGVLTFFSSKTSFELMISNRKIFYCLGENASENLGNRLLTELNEDELMDLTYRSFSEMMKVSIESFIFEEKVFNIELPSKFKGFELESILANS